MNNYRCTRNEPYVQLQSPAWKDLTLRQGYYLQAESETGAIERMKRMFPSDTQGFTARIWTGSTLNQN